jgi:hypothetical protein
MLGWEAAGPGTVALISDIAIVRLMNLALYNPSELLWDRHGYSLPKEESLLRVIYGI